jgi:hypothetical protein
MSGKMSGLPRSCDDLKDLGMQDLVELILALVTTIDKLRSENQELKTGLEDTQILLKVTKVCSP